MYTVKYSTLLCITFYWEAKLWTIIPFLILIKQYRSANQLYNT